jgi:Na+-transporting NADH:ubiquinone oxidoreductase subunit B
VPSVWDSFIGTIPGSIGETSTAMILLGAAFLLFTGVANWRVMLSVFMGGAFMGFIFNLIGANPYMNMPFYEHLVVGGFAFGAVFMATDPVTAAQTERGKWIYGFLIGAITLIVRILNPAYPEGMMLSILLMNIFASTIDHFVVRKNVKRRMNRLKVKAQA